MGGVLGVVGLLHADETTTRFELASQVMQRRNLTPPSVYHAEGGRWAFGKFESSRGALPAREFGKTSAPCALFHGVLYNSQELWRRVEGSSSAREEQVSQLILALYAEYGIRFLEYMEGEFCLAVADPLQRRVFIATDTVGSHPVYWHHDSDGLIFCTNLSALLCATPSARRLDFRAVADYITLGSLLGDRTLVQGVSLLAPGAVVEYKAQGGVASVRRYIDLATFFENKCHSKEIYLESVEAEFQDAVDRALKSTRRVGLALSGGLDSRAILSACGERAKTLQTYTLGIDGCADQVISERLARIAGSEHRFFALDQSYLRDFLPNMVRMVSMTDGMYVSHGLTEMLALQFLGETGIEVLLRGHGGELAKARLAWPLHTDDSVYRLNSTEALAEYLSRRANYITGGLALSDLLVPEAARAAGDGSRSAFREVLADTGLSPAACCSYLYLRELTRRFTIPSIELFRTVVEVRLPYLDRRFLKALLGAPPEWRDSTEIHQRLIAGGIGRLGKVRNSNTGAPAIASPKTEYVLDKFNSLFKRFNIRGFRHYHNFDAWMRTMLLQSVESELMTSESQTKRFIDNSVLKRLIDETRNGVDDRGYLLQVLLILEIWQRENGVTADVR